VTTATIFIGIVLNIVAANKHARAELPSAPEGISGTFGESTSAPSIDPATGAMTYIVPFDLPAARGDAQPVLGLHYRSMSGTGEAGEGWSLGLPVIERVSLSGWPTYADSGDPGSEDRFAYGGSALTFICTVGERDALPPGQLVCPAEAGPMPPWARGYRHYRRHVDTGGERFFLSPDRRTWIVQRKGGEILELGFPLARQDLSVEAVDVDRHLPNSIFRWNITRQYDLHGIESGVLGVTKAKNLTVYTWGYLGLSVSDWDSIGARAYLTDIYYTPPAINGGSAPASAFAYHVQLSWEAPAYPQASVTDPLIYFQHHNTHIEKRRHEMRLRRVAIAAKNWEGTGEREFVRAYNLTYYDQRGVPPAMGQAPLWSRFFLKEVQLEGRCAIGELLGRIPEQTSCLKFPAQSFEYENANIEIGNAVYSPLEAIPAVGNEGLNYVANTAVLDINHDGFPDIVQGWPQNMQVAAWGDDNGIAAWYPECNEPDNSDGRVDVWVHVSGSAAGPLLTCGYSDSTYVIRSAREHIAYINRGPNNTGPLNLQHHCLDSGDGNSGVTKWQLMGPTEHSPAALFTQWGAEAVGPWGDALLLWNKAEQHGFAIVPTPAAESFCPNARGPDGNPNHPSLRWVETSDSFWAKRPVAPQPPREGGVYVDIDGDGLIDRLSAASEQADGFQRAKVHLSKRIHSLQTTDGIKGPALVPFTGSPETADATLAVAGPGVYADVNGDGVVDLISFNSFDPFDPLPIVRPGDGHGHFGCSDNDPRCLVPGNSSWLGRGYRILDPDSSIPWPLIKWDGGGPVCGTGGQSRMVFFHDVTGDGLADLVLYEPNELAINGSCRGFIRLWVNVDGQTFRCANSYDACRVGVLLHSNRPTGGFLDTRVVFADMDANGTDDILILGQHGAWHFSFITVAPMENHAPRAPRPGLLTRIRNGIGADFEIAYETIQELDRGATLEDPLSFYHRWATHVPSVIPVVTRITLRPTPHALGQSLDQPYSFYRTTNFEYRDPAYDLWERSFKGFRRVRAIHPDRDVTQTWYWFGDCESGSALPVCAHTSDGSKDAAFVGLPVRVDRFVPGHGEHEPTQWLSTTVTRYGTARFSPSSPAHFASADRDVLRAEVGEIHEFLYDTSAPVNLYEDENPVEMQPVPTQPGKRVRIVTTLEYDKDGNITTVVKKGRQDDTGPVPFYPDPIITLVSTPTFPQRRCGADWACRPTGTLVNEQRKVYGVDQSEIIRQTFFDWNSAGDLLHVRGDLNYPWWGNEARLDRATSLGTGVHPTASTGPGERVLREIVVNEFGTPTRVLGARGLEGVTDPNRSCTDFIPDQAYVQFPSTVIRHTAAPCSGAALRTELRFDRGLQRLAAHIDPAQSLTTVAYDPFGRASTVHKPAPGGGPGATALALERSYHDKSPGSFVYTELSVDNRVVKSYEIFNGLGEHVLGFDQADTTADGAPWIQRDWTRRDEYGRVRFQFRPSKFSGDPFQAANTASVAVPAGGTGFWTNYDAFGRIQSRTDEALITAEYTYRPLEMEVRDAEQRDPGSSHTGASSIWSFDGHGRLSETRRVGDGDTVWTTIDYLGTGEPRSIGRRHANGVDSYQRTFRWDSFGRLVENDEPNTALSTPDHRRNWKYVYDDEGRLVGTSDARGCGKDLYYDGLSRLLAEDFWPCEPGQLPHTTPNLTTGDGTEVFYRYDSYEPGQVAPPSVDFVDSAKLALGRLVSIRDRGSHTRYNYDERGRVRQQTRRIAKPGAPAEALANRYTSQWFTETTDFDLGDRLIKRRTPTVTGALLVNGESAETFDYSDRGLLKTVGSSYGTLASGFYYSPNGSLRELTYGDAASTRAGLGYDSRDRLWLYWLVRWAAPIWSSPTPFYSTPGSDTTQLDLAYYYFQYDKVGNPIQIDDISSSTWPAGARTVSRTAVYDDAYRLREIQYNHGGDIHIPAFEPEMATGDPRPVPERRGATRIVHQWFDYDWQGNTTTTDDDAALRYDRSLGVIVNGGTDGQGAHEGPNQLRSADGIQTKYDAAGQLTELLVARSSCETTVPKCSHRFRYEWDEIGQLARARRWDFPAGPVPAFDPNATPVWDLTHAYSGGERVLSTSRNAQGVARHTLDVFGTFRASRVDYVPAATDYHIKPEHEIRFLAGMGRAFFDHGEAPMPTANGTPIHVFLGLGDHLGSTAFVIDKDSGEVVERAGYQAHGAVESDFRPERWGAVREELKFTGKEEDIEVGLVYFGARYYHPHLGRWVSPDPLTIHGLGGDVNPYAYVGGRVMTRTDPWGLESIPAGAQDIRLHEGGWSAFVPGVGTDFEVGTYGASSASDWAANAGEKVARTAEGLEAHDLGARVELPYDRYVTQAQVGKAAGQHLVDAAIPIPARIAGVSAPVILRQVQVSSDPLNKSAAMGTAIGIFVEAAATAGASEAESVGEVLGSAARALHAQLTGWAQIRRVTVVLETYGGRRIVAVGSKSYVSRPQQALAKLWGMIVPKHRPAHDVHAELRAVFHAILRLGDAPKSIAVQGAKICPYCREILEATGAVISDTGTSAVWPTP
jgi:RHS repeat-associated protein